MKTGYIACVAALFAALTAGVATGAESVKITSPEASREYKGFFVLSAEVTGIRRLAVVKVEYAHLTHYLAAVPDRNGRAVVTDEYLPAADGPQQLQVAVFETGSGDELARTSMSVNAKMMDEAWLVNVRKDFASERVAIAWAARKLEEAWSYYLAAVAKAEETNTEQGWNYAADMFRQYTAARCVDFHDRIAQYVSIAEARLAMGQVGEALKAARVAQKIYDTEKGFVSKSPRLRDMPILFRPDAVQDAPKHMRLLARLALIAGDTQEALAWITAEQAFYDTQAYSGHLDPAGQLQAIAKAAKSCRESAKIAMLITGDYEAYQKRMQEAEKVESE